MDNDIIIETFPVGPLEVNCSIIYSLSTKKALVIDPGDDYAVFSERIRKKGLILDKLLHTHGHFDHIGTSAKIKKTNQVPIYLHKDDRLLYQRLKEQGELFGFPTEPPAVVDVFFNDGHAIGWAGSSGKPFITVIHTPGHSPGSSCFYTEITGKPVLFSGDTLFARSIGRTDVFGGNHAKILSSIKEKLFLLPSQTEVIPGHGPYTVLGIEKKENPFLDDSEL
ncbi:MAG: MBL fold metallo-hydrolase [Candidatus Aureabacteria bacterium]|nr:MBL fold metallo-hydrolase [Candidatus Auribacterota bacterium]